MAWQWTPYTILPLTGVVTFPSFIPPDAGERGGCEVRVELRADDGQYSLMVSDNGVGFPQDLDFRDAGSLGLQLVNTLVEQIEGTIELDRNDGTAFKITFTEPRYEEGG